MAAASRSARASKQEPINRDGRARIRCSQPDGLRDRIRPSLGVYKPCDEVGLVHLRQRSGDQSHRSLRGRRRRRQAIDRRVHEAPDQAHRAPLRRKYPIAKYDVFVAGLLSSAEALYGTWPELREVKSELNDSAWLELAGGPYEIGLRDDEAHAFAKLAARGPTRMSSPSRIRSMAARIESQGQVVSRLPLHPARDEHAGPSRHASAVRDRELPGLDRGIRCVLHRDRRRASGRWSRTRAAYG